MPNPPQSTDEDNSTDGDGIVPVKYKWQSAELAFIYEAITAGMGGGGGGGGGGDASNAQLATLQAAVVDALVNVNNSVAAIQGYNLEATQLRIEDLLHNNVEDFPSIGGAGYTESWLKTIWRKLQNIYRTLQMLESRTQYGEGAEQFILASQSLGLGYGGAQIGGVPGGGELSADRTWRLIENVVLDFDLGGVHRATFEIFGYTRVSRFQNIPFGATGNVASLEIFSATVNPVLSHISQCVTLTPRYPLLEIRCTGTFDANGDVIVSQVGFIPYFKFTI